MLNLAHLVNLSLPLSGARCSGSLGGASQSDFAPCTAVRLRLITTGTSFDHTPHGFSINDLIPALRDAARLHEHLHAGQS